MNLRHVLHTALSALILFIPAIKQQQSSLSCLVFGGVGARGTPAEQGGGVYAGDLPAQMHLMMHEQLVLCL